MSPSRPLVSALAMIVTLGVACTPSSNVGPAARACGDSATEATRDTAPEAAPLAPTPPVAPDVITNSTPEVAAPPRPPVAARPVYVPQPTGPYRIRIVDENHHDLPKFANGGRTYVMGTVGSRYSIVVANPTSRRVEVVLSIDGLDAMDGHPANYVAKRGYILSPYEDATIDGFRTSLEDVATFRFSSVADSYAGRLGQPRDVGVIGAAFFPEQAPVIVWQPPPPPQSYAPARPRAMPHPSPATDDLASNSYSGGTTRGGGGAAPSAQGAPASPSATSAAPADEPAKKRPGLGTEFGEARVSHIGTTEFTRANPSHPSQVVSIRYNDRAGLVALGIVFPQPYASVENDLGLRESADPFRQNRFAQPPP